MLSESETIHVILLMAGGHQCELSLSLDAPLLRELFQVLMNPSEAQTTSKVFEIPIEEDNSCLCFPSQSLVAVATDPAVDVQKILSPTEQSEKPKQPPPKIIESIYVQLDNFLTPVQHNDLLNYVFPQHSMFGSASRDRTHSDSFERLRSEIVSRVEAVLPEVLHQLGIPSFPIGSIEAESIFKTYGHHDPFTRDNSSPETAKRIVSFVYFFYPEPKPFTGGELLIYDSKIVNKACMAAESFKTVEPRNNSIVFFFSSYSYESLPISDRFTVSDNKAFQFKGWVTQ